MKKTSMLIFGLLVIGTMILTSCGGGAAAPAAQTGEKVKAVFLIGGTLGDKSFNDSTHRGLVQAEEEGLVDYEYIEASSDPAKIDAAFNDLLNDDSVDIIIQAQGQLIDQMYEVAPQYPEKKFIIFDNPFDFEKCPECKANVYAIQYAQNEGSYLAGYYGCLMAESKIIGAVGGQDIPVINDFMVGYVKGAVDAGCAEADVLIQYAASWTDPAKGKELALTMYQQGADVVFQVAGGTGEGVFYAAEEAGKWAIGVDSDQALIIEESNPDQAKVILTSMLKNVDKSMLRAMKMNADGTLPWGTNELLGINEDGVGLALNKYYEENTPQEVKDQLAAAIEKVKAGEVEIPTVY
ncbi:MAG: BMP family ABC transporter substrate-binding protein [Leptolinea sp.]|nr:BMP family ABC transporter substrate-binding protein [Leptolinea sp.]